MKKLGDQWIETIDGEEHMFKAVTPITNGHCDIKDIGVMKDGLLPCPFCGEYPEVAHYGFIESYYTYCVGCGINLDPDMAYNTKQEAKDAWNRRA